MTNSGNIKRFDKIKAHLERIYAAIVNGFDRLDKKIDTKADSSDLQKALGLLDALVKRQ
jgi:hypothetical protein